MRILVTGGAGFIGSNYVRLLLADDADERVVNLDLLTYAGNLENLAGCENDPRYRFVRGDVRDRDLVRSLLAGEGIDAVVHFAAESHVDRSVEGPEVFVATNVLGTEILLEEARAAGVARFVMVSTDEVYGSLGETGRFTEDTPLAPNSPYAASKAAADLLCRAFHRTYGLPGDDHALQQQLRRLPVSREADPPDDRQRPGGQAPPRLRRRPQRARLALGRGPLPGRGRGAAAGRARPGLQRRAAATSWRTSTW